MKRSNVRSSKETPYARLEQKVAWHDEYSGSPVYYYVGHCDTCNVHDQRFGERAYGETKERWRGAPDDWVKAHNQHHHQDETRPRLSAAPAAVQVQLVCGHRHKIASDGTARGDMVARAHASLAKGSGGACGRPLRVYEGGWHYDQPLYVCDFGHLVEVPERLDNAQIAHARKGINAKLAEVREQFDLDQLQRQIDSRRKRPHRPLA
jgi:hypothetical protein